MRVQDKINTIAEFGFSPRQARFLVLVMRHAGVCLLRQYSALAGIVHGQKTRAFFQKLVDAQYASAYRCRHNRGRLYHVHHLELYQAIGEPNTSHRRPLAAGSIRDRLMRLDAVLADARLDWLATPSEKLVHFALSMRSATGDLPAGPARKLGASSAERACADRCPIGIDPTGRVVLLYLAPSSGRDDFRGFLRRHAELLQGLPAWTLRLVLPRHLAHAYEVLQRVVREEWESPLDPRTVEELRWYFEQHRAAANRPASLGEDERWDRAAGAFARPRFSGLYRRWVRDGDQAMDGLSSTEISDAIASGAGRVECLVLPHRYDHLSPLVDPVESPGCSDVMASEDMNAGAADAVSGDELLDTLPRHVSRLLRRRRGPDLRLTRSRTPSGTPVAADIASPRRISGSAAQMAG